MKNDAKYKLSTGEESPHPELILLLHCLESLRCNKINLYNCIYE